MDESKFIESIQSEVYEHWGKYHNPLLLSALSPLLEKRFIGYKNLLGSLTLTAFVERSSQVGKYKILRHTSQFAKVGVVPIDANYEFPVIPEVEIGMQRKHRHTDLGDLVIFLKVLKKLPDSDLENFQIPAVVLVKLIK